MSESTDIIVIGAGIAGAGVAAELSADASVTLLEREAFPGYHATGRSAALFSEIYGGAVVRRLTSASRAFLFSPPPGFVDAPLTKARGFMCAAREDQLAALKDHAERPGIASAVEVLSSADVLALCPILRPDVVRSALLEPGARDIDVDLLHQGYLRQLRARGGRLVTDCEVLSMRRAGAAWRLDTTRESYEARTIVNAAGAWADEIARRADVGALGLTPMRRTAVLVEAPVDAEIGAWPLVVDAGEQFYFKPDAGRLLLSPADETLSAPCDAQPEQLDIAIAIDRVQAFADLEVRRVVRSWAGLRSFVQDRTPVAGFDAEAPGFFWLAGQGGFGIQTAPALSRAAAALITKGALPADLMELGVSADGLSPTRLRAEP